MKQEFKFSMLPGECWYGACAQSGFEMPFDESSNHTVQLDPNVTPNQAAPLLCSNLGRYLWCEEPFDLCVKAGTLILTSRGIPELHEGFGSLRGAYRQAQSRHFPASQKTPAKKFFVRPQYNTWIEIMYHQNQKQVLEYARSMVDNGFEPGVLMIDDCWSEYYGCWEFDPLKFPDPKAMVCQLHDMGFSVMLWTCPFISPDSKEFRELEAMDALVKNKDGEAAIIHWWNGYSAALDMTNPKAQDWYAEKNQLLMDRYGIDGFKMDAGDGYFYHYEDQMAQPVGPNGQTEAWARFAARYEYNELRACWKNGGQPLMQRLADKNHSWGTGGIAGLIPNELAQGIIGCAFSCPDMIGGGQYADFQPGAVRFSEELFVRYAQIAALMPMMQFSASPVRVLSKENCEIVRNMAKLHMQFADTIWALAEAAARTGEPIVRYLEYGFPHQGLEHITDQFMLGEHILVAPVIKEGQRERTVVFPEGTWKSPDGKTYTGPCEAVVPAPLECLPYFERCGE